MEWNKLTSGPLRGKSMMATRMHKIPIGHILRNTYTLKTNHLLAVVELKRLFQGSLSLEDFHMKALRLVAQAGYTGAAKDKVLRDNIISGLASDKI